MSWDDDTVLAFDFETSGSLPEYALQPWRLSQESFWATSLVWLWRQDEKIIHKGDVWPTRKLMKQMLEQALDEHRMMLGWNTVFDISVLLAYGFEKEVMQISWLDGMLIWRHFFLEPEYDAKPGKRKSYSLKSAVPEFIPEHAGYEEGIDYHSTDPAMMAKLHFYNIQDNMYTLRVARRCYNKLTSKQRRCMQIEARCLPLVAKANLRGMLVDTPYLRDLSASLINTKNGLLKKLAPHGVTEAIVRSPIKLRKLMYEDWGLDPIKFNKSKVTGLKTPSTDKESLYELAFDDPRAGDLRKLREAMNLKSKFADALITSSNYNNDFHTHPSAHVFGTYSGRLTYSSKQRQPRKNKKPDVEDVSDDA
jgi:DNA polymerase I-like protein with 3'-5' exonuclease and polymerase domains